MTSQPAASPLKPHQVADMLDTLATAEQQVADVLDNISASRSRVSRASVAALERLLVTLRPATDVRARLTGLDRRLLAAGIRVRRERRGGLHLVSGESQ